MHKHAKFTSFISSFVIVSSTSQRPADPFSLFIKDGKELWSSRCGNISETKDFLEEMYKTDHKRYDTLIRTFITKHETLDQIERAFAEARNPEHLKVVIDVAHE